MTYWSVPLVASLLVNGLILGAALTLKAHPLPTPERRVEVRVRITRPRAVPPPKPKPTLVVPPKPVLVTPKPVKPTPPKKVSTKPTTPPKLVKVPPKPPEKQDPRDTPTPTPTPMTTAKGRARDPQAKDTAPTADAARALPTAPRPREATPIPDLHDPLRVARADLPPDARMPSTTPANTRGPQPDVALPSTPRAVSMEGQQGMRRGADLTPSMMPIDSAARAGSGPEVFISLLHGDWDLPTGIHESPGYSSGQDYRYIGLTPGSVGKAAGGDPLFGSYGEYGGGAFGRHGDGLGGVSTRTADPSPFRVGDGIANALALLESDGPRGGGYTPGSRNMTDHGLVTTSPGMSVPRGGGADGPGYGFGGGPTTTGTRIAGIPRSDGIGGPNTGITPRATPGYTPDGPDGPDGPDRPTNPPPGGGGKPDGSGTVGEGHGSNDPGSRGVRGPVTVVGGAWGVNARLIYPPDARDQGIEGRVELSISVDITGQARNKAVVIRKSGHAILDRYAREQASQWYFYPKDGNRRDEVITVIVEFKLNG